MSILMPSVICELLHVKKQLVDHCVTQEYTSWTIRHTHAKVLVSTLDHQVSLGDANGEVVDQQCDLAYTLEHGK